MKNTKQLLRGSIPVIAIICTVVFVPWKMFWAWARPLPGTVQEQLKEGTALGFDGIVVYVDQAGKAPAFYAAGWKNRETKAVSDPHALFKIASISKLYIAAATARMVYQKRLSLDATLSQLLPEVAGRIENADKITLRMLVQHRSGIPDWIEDPAFPWTHSLTTAEVLALVLDDPAEFKPGKRYDYSNTNYLLIGNILDKALGYSHHQYIKKELLDPLKLTHTYSLLSEVNAEEVVSGYHLGQKGDTKALDFVAPGGSMVATAQDVGVFLRALNDGSLLNKEEQVIYTGLYPYEHTGSLPGYQSIARYHKDIDAVVIQFVNTSGGDMWTFSDIVYHRVVRILKK